MIPGWPPPRPFTMPSSEELLAGLLANPRVEGREEELAEDLARRAGLPALAGTVTARLRRLSRSRRLRALLGLLALMDTVGCVIEAVEAELLALSQMRQDGEDDWAEAGAHRRLIA